MNSPAKRGKWTRAVAILVVACLSGCASPGTRAEQWNACSNPVRDPDRAITACTTVIRSQEPASQAKAYEHRGTAWLARSQLDRAIEDFNSAVKLAPDDRHLLLLRADTYRDNRQYKRAIEEFDRIIQRDPNNGEAFVSRGRAWLLDGQTDRAFQDYDEAIRLMPNNTLALIERGTVYAREKHQYERAIQDFDAAIRINANSAPAYFHRGSAYEALATEKGLTDERAMDDLRKAASLDRLFDRVSPH